MIKTQFHGEPTTMAIGDGLNDVLMMREADIGIEICEGIEEQIRMNASDVAVENLASIQELVNVIGRKIQYNHSTAQFYLIY